MQFYSPSEAFNVCKMRFSSDTLHKYLRNFSEICTEVFSVMTQ